MKQMLKYANVIANVLVLFIVYYLIYSCTLLSFYFTILYCMSRILVSFVSINFIIIINVFVAYCSTRAIGSLFTDSS